MMAYSPATEHALRKTRELQKAKAEKDRLDANRQKYEELVLIILAHLNKGTVDDLWCEPVGSVSRAVNLPLPAVAGILEELRDKGLVGYRIGLPTKPGDIHGGGWFITEMGEMHLKRTGQSGD